MMTSRKLMIFGLIKLTKKSSSLSILCIIISVHNQENEEVMSRRSGSSRKTKSSSSSSSFKSRKSGKSINKHVINEKMKLADLEVLASFRKQQTTEASSKRNETGDSAN